jgi:hypothetical protein
MDIALSPPAPPGTSPGGKRILRSDRQNRGRALETAILINIWMNFIQERGHVP